VNTDEEQRAFYQEAPASNGVGWNPAQGRHQELGAKILFSVSPLPSRAPGVPKQLRRQCALARRIKPTMLAEPSHKRK